MKQKLHEFFDRSINYRIIEFNDLGKCQLNLFVACSTFITKWSINLINKILFHADSNMYCIW